MKKGLVYSLMSVLLITPIILLFVIYSKINRMEGQNTVVEIRADELGSFYKSFMHDLGRSLDISTRRSLLYSNNFIIANGIPFDNPAGKFSQLILEGNLDGEEIGLLTGSDTLPCNTLTCHKERYLTLSDEFGYNLDVEIISVDIRPYDSWNINSSVTLRITIEDPEMEMKIDKIAKKSVKVPVLDFEDPLYFLNTKGKISRKIKKASNNPFTSGTNGKGWFLGEVVQNPTSGDKSKILIAENVDGLNPTQLNQFTGLVTDNDIQPPIGLDIPFLAGTENGTSIEIGEIIYVENTTFKVWDIDSEIVYKNYHSSDSGPSYFDRLENRTYISDTYKTQSPHAIGLVSFVDLDEMESRGLQVNRSLSALDYKYFRGESDSVE